jgi:hypothetical protein
VFPTIGATGVVQLNERTNRVFQVAYQKQTGTITRIEEETGVPDAAI